MLNIYPLSLLLGEQALQSFYVAFTYRYGEHLTISWCGQEATKVLMRDRRTWLWRPAGRTGTADILHQNAPRAALGPAVPPTGCASLLSPSPPWQSSSCFGFSSHSQSRSPLSLLCLPLGGRSRQAETEHPVNDMMKKYPLFLSTEGKWTISSFFFPPFTIQQRGQAKGVYFCSSVTCWTDKSSYYYIGRLEEIRTIRVTPCHQFWLYALFHNEEALEDVNLLEIQEWERK